MDWGGHVPELLDRIDAVIDGKCPCGDDCTPTHIAGDTDTTGAGEYGAQSTSMRWRPDLVSAVDDSERVLAEEYQRGRFNAQVYTYPHEDRLHFRLDDGHRFVGCDVDGLNCTADYCSSVWERLERELGNSRHLDPPKTLDVSLVTAACRSRLPAGPVRSCSPLQCDASQGGTGNDDPLLGIAKAEGHSALAADARRLARRYHVVFLREHLQRSFGAALNGLRLAFEPALRAVHMIGAAVAKAENDHAPTAVTGHPMQLVMEQRRNRSTGPSQQQRAPRQINPRRGR